MVGLFYYLQSVLFVYLFICLFVYLFICLFVYLFICLFVYLFICLFVYLFICLFVYLFICLFVYTSFKFRNPLIYLTLLVNHPCLKVLFTRFVFMMCMASFLFLIPLYLENMIDFSSATSGGIMLFTMIIVAVRSPLTGKLLDRISSSRPLLISLLITLISTVLMLWYDLTISWWVLIPSLIIFWVAMGMHILASINGDFRAVPKEK